ncbi:hypothetical protein ACFYKX_07555 [Cytobacillus sp. FJAT-54145]|uniref:Uncharacterized protein n=1 Tax=Cytobacillus spartinae TaxID=3299023 RepID=A0ABW6K9P0_9BACI
MREKETFFPNVSLGGKLPKDKGKDNKGPERRDQIGDNDKDFKTN